MLKRIDPALQLRELIGFDLTILIRVEHRKEHPQWVVSLSVRVGARQNAFVRLGLLKINHSVGIAVTRLTFLAYRSSYVPVLNSINWTVIIVFCGHPQQFEMACVLPAISGNQLNARQPRRAIKINITQENFHVND